tara:strand:- start:93 stop:281 length:189 start_codon:yes stop_codon:yes gene_type:complete
VVVVVLPIILLMVLVEEMVVVLVVHMLVVVMVDTGHKLQAKLERQTLEVEVVQLMMLKMQLL